MQSCKDEWVETYEEEDINGSNNPSTQRDESGEAFRERMKQLVLNL